MNTQKQTFAAPPPSSPRHALLQKLHKQRHQQPKQLSNPPPAARQTQSLYDSPLPTSDMLSRRASSPKKTNIPWPQQIKIWAYDFLLVSGFSITAASAWYLIHVDSFRKAAAHLTATGIDDELDQLFIFGALYAGIPLLIIHNLMIRCMVSDKCLGVRKSVQAAATSAPLLTSNSESPDSQDSSPFGTPNTAPITNEHVSRRFLTGTTDCAARLNLIYKRIFPNPYFLSMAIAFRVRMILEIIPFGVWRYAHGHSLKVFNAALFSWVTSNEVGQYLILLGLLQLAVNAVSFGVAVKESGWGCLYSAREGVDDVPMADPDAVVIIETTTPLGSFRALPGLHANLPLPAAAPAHVALGR